MKDKFSKLTAMSESGSDICVIVDWASTMKILRLLRIPQAFYRGREQNGLLFEETRKFNSANLIHALTNTVLLTSDALSF